MKNVKIITIILAIILVTSVAFGGVYLKTQNRMENKVKDYAFSRELNGGRIVELKVVTEEETENENEDVTEEETVDTDNNLTVENYEITKKTIEERLDNLGAHDYTISLNKDDGTIRVEMAEDDLTDTYVYFLTADGKVKITEKESGTELLSDSMVKKTTYAYTINAEGQYIVYMEVKLTEEGQAKIEEIQNEYAILADEVEKIEAAQKKEDKDNTESEDETTTEETSTEEATKKIAVLTIAGSEYDVEKIEKDTIRVNIGSATTSTTNLNNYINRAAELALLINSGKYPIEYEITDRFETGKGKSFVYTDITEEQLVYIGIAMAIIMFVAFVILIIKYKTRGLLASISFIGFVSVLLLLLRYTNVNISIEGIGAIILTLIINFRINQIMLSATNNIDYKGLLLKLVPVVIIALVFSFAGWSNLSSFGMIMFWGLVLIAVYNILLTKTLLKLKESK